MTPPETTTDRTPPYGTTNGRRQRAGTTAAGTTGDVTTEGATIATGTFADATTETGTSGDATPGTDDPTTATVGPTPGTVAPMTATDAPTTAIDAPTTAPGAATNETTTTDTTILGTETRASSAHDVGRRNYPNFCFRKGGLALLFIIRSLQLISRRSSSIKKLKRPPGQYPLSQSTTCFISRPSRKLARFSLNTAATSFTCVTAATCGVTFTFGCAQSGECCGSGSVVNTSRTHFSTPPGASSAAQMVSSAS
mmetsp:Transcript_8274/g.27522  ORF Transcript_8274/g.27522 Transcript_8274/m.27522 type:complete len:253 (-) Transcript_8274:233-991(-)